MGRLTRYIGGQTVTDSTGTGERQLEMVSALPGTPLSGILYLTPSEVANAVELTDFTLQSAASITNAAGSFTVRVSGEEGAEFSITGTDGASNVGNTVIPSAGFIDVSVNVSAQATSAAVRNPTATLVPNPSSDPETVLADGFTDLTESVSQAAGPLPQVGGFSIAWTNPTGGTYDANINSNGNTNLTPTLDMTNSNSFPITISVRFNASGGMGWNSVPFAFSGSGQVWPTIGGSVSSGSLFSGGQNVGGTVNGGSFPANTTQRFNNGQWRFAWFQANGGAGSMDFIISAAGHQDRTYTALFTAVQDA